MDKEYVVSIEIVTREYKKDKDGNSVSKELRRTYLASHCKTTERKEAIKEHDRLYDALDTLKGR